MAPFILTKILKNKWLFAANVILFGVGLGVSITFATLRSTKTMALAFAMVICIPFILIIFKDIKQLLLAALIMCLPVTIDMTINPSDHIGGSSGYIISAFDMLLVGLYILWIYEILLKREVRILYFFSISLPGSAIILAAFASMINARYTDLCLFETVEIIKMFLAFLYLANNIKTKKEINVILLVLLASLFLEGTLGILQRRLSDTFWPTALGGPHFIRNDRVSGTWVSTNDYSWCVTFLLPVAFSLLLSSAKALYKYVLLVTVALGVGGLIYSKSRAGMLALPVSIFFVAAMAFGKIRNKKRMFNLFFALIAVAFFSSPLYPKLWHSVTYRFVNDDGGSAESRMPQFIVAWKIIKDNTVFGIGVNNYSEVMWEYDTEASAESLSEITRHPVHNIFLGIMAEMGLIGIIAFFWFISSIFKQGLSCIRQNDHFHHFAVIGMLGGILAFLAHGLVDAGTIGNKLYMFIWVYASIITAIKNISYRDNLSGDLAKGTFTQ